MNREREQQIAARAYQLWEEEGRPHGAHERHWIQASRDVEAGVLSRPGVRAKAAAKPKAAAVAKAKAAAKAKPVAAAKAKPAGAATIAAQPARATTGGTKSGKAPAKKPEK
jgi:hypothetical protein